MRQNESVAPMLGDGGYPDIIDVRATRDRPVVSNVSVATNTPTDWKTAVVAGLFVVGTSAVLGVALWYYSNMPGWLVFAVTFSLLLYAGYRVIIIVNGDHVASLEVRKNEKIAMKNIESIDKEVDSNREVIIAKIDAQDRHLERQHVEKMAVIVGDQFKMEMAERVGNLEEIIYEVKGLLEVDAGMSRVKHNYVSGKPQPIPVAISEWLNTVYLPEGATNPDTIHHPSLTIKRAPWTNDWANRDSKWITEAEGMLTQGESSILIPVVRNGKPSAYKLRYDRKIKALNSIGRG